MIKKEHLYILCNLVLIVVLSIVLIKDFIEFDVSITQYLKDVTLLLPFSLILLSFVSILYHVQNLKQSIIKKAIAFGNNMFYILLIISTLLALSSLFSTTSFDILISEYLGRFLAVLFFLIVGLLYFFNSIRFFKTK